MAAVELAGPMWDVYSLVEAAVGRGPGVAVAQVMTVELGPTDSRLGLYQCLHQDRGRKEPPSHRLKPEPPNSTPTSIFVSLEWRIKPDFVRIEEQTR